MRRFQPETGDGPYWESFDVELEESLSVLDALLHARSDQDGTLAVRCSCRAAICGSCGVKVNGQSTLACKTKIQDAQNEANRKAGIVAGDPVAPGGADRPVALPSRHRSWSSRWATCP